MAVGLINGLFGAGGGIIAIALFKREWGMEQHNAHATTMGLIFPLATMSAVVYGFSQRIDLTVPLLAALGAIPGGWLGARLMSRLSGVWLSRIFSIFMLVAAVRMLWGD